MFQATKWLGSLQAKGGTTFFMRERLGSWQVGTDPAKGKVEFKLFFPKGSDPQIEAIRVAGTFQQGLGAKGNWDFAAGPALTRDDSRPDVGTFWYYRSEVELPHGFYEYKYLVTFKGGVTRIVSDPYARYGGRDSQNAAFVIGGSRPEENVVAPLAHGRKPLRDLVIYEMMLDDFTDEDRSVRAPLDAACDRLDDLKNLGVTAILVMPWTAWENPNFDWGYAPLLYFSVEYRYANNLIKPAEKLSYLARFVSECHKRDIHVIMDGVFNHASMEFPYKKLYLKEEECPYTGKFGGDFGGLQDLDFSHECTQEFIRDVCVYWFETCGIDGIRLDNTVNYRVDGSVHGLPELLQDVSDYMDSKGEKNFSLTLEHIDVSAVQVTNDTRATSYWDNSLYEQCFSHLWTDQIQPAALRALNNQRFLASADKVPTIYLSNHDHSHVTWQAGARENAGAFRWWKTQPWAIALMTGPSTPMIQNGQEFGEDHWIPENDEGTGRRVMPRPLRWKESQGKIGKALLRLYTRLAEIRNQYPGLRSPNFYPQVWEDWMRLPNSEGYGLDADKQVMIYHRWGHASGVLQRFMVVINFSASKQWVSVPFPENGTWTDLLSEFRGTWQPEVRNFRLELEVGPHWGHIFFK